MHCVGRKSNFRTCKAAFLLAVVSALCVMLLRLMLAGSALRAQDGAPSYPTVEPRPWDFCLVCERPVDKTDRVYEIDGQRVPVHTGACDEKFKQNPDRYLAKLKPRGAFLGADPSGFRTFSSGWLVLGLYILIGLVFAGMCAYRAVNQSLRPVPWFFWGLIFNLFAYLVLVSRARGVRSQAPWGVPHGLAKVPLTYTPDRCPACGETNHPSATSCSTCGSRLDPHIASEVAKSGL